MSEAEGRAKIALAGNGNRFAASGSRSEQDMPISRKGGKGDTIDHISGESDERGTISCEKIRSETGGCRRWSHGVVRQGGRSRG